MNTITAGEMLGFHNDLYQMCKRFIKNHLNNESYTVEELQKEFTYSVYENFTNWVDMLDKPIITTQRINLLLDIILQKEFDTLVDVSAYIRLLVDELKCLIKQLKGYKSKDIISDVQLTTLNDTPQILEELKLTLTLF